MRDRRDPPNGPPPGIHQRPPTWTDLGAVTALLNRCDVVDIGYEDSTEDDLTEDWRAPGFSLATDAWLLTGDEGDLLAYGSVAARGEEMIDSFGCVRPDRRGRGIGRYLLGLKEHRAHEMLTGRGAEESGRIGEWCSSRDAATQELLDSHGYEPVRRFWQMTIELEPPPPVPDWPPGIELRPFELADARAFHEAVEEAFSDFWGHAPSTFEEFVQRRIESPQFDPSLWLTAVEGDEIAGVCLSTDEGGMGWINTLGVRPPWRRRGLGRALLLETFRLFVERGRSTVRLGTDSQSPTGAGRLYESAGMTVAAAFDRYEKPLRPPPK